MTLYRSSKLRQGFVLDLTNTEDLRFFDELKRFQKLLGDYTLLFGVEVLDSDTIYLEILEGEKWKAEVERRRNLDARAYRVSPMALKGLA